MISDNGELLQALVDRKLFSREPAAAVVALEESPRDWPAMTPQQSAMLKWLLQSLAYWEVSYPLAPELRDALRALAPGLAGLALADPAFAAPGSHPVHRALDALHAQALGWQPGLGRAGDNLHRALLASIAELERCLERGDGEALEALARQAATWSAAETRRLDLMRQRLAEAERGHHRAAEARRTAARAINDTLGRHALPSPVARFVRGPWYASAQLVLLKFGEQSPEWERMCSTTEHLARSLQPGEIEGDDEEHRQRVLARIQGLPAELRRWLLSLQHDDEAATDAIGLIEFAHLRLLRQQPLALQPVEPLAVDGEEKAEEKAETAEDNAEESSGVPGRIGKLAEGDWFLLQGDSPGREQRLQLAIKLDARRQLVFSNRAGARALAMGFAGFDRALAGNLALPLGSGGSFSLSLLRAAGVTRAEQLEALGAGDSSGPGPSSGRAVEEAAGDGDFPAAPAPPGDTGDLALPPELDLRDAAPGDDADTPSVQESLGLSTGTWLGFHDCDPPMLARLAAHDRDRDLFIFVNRRGAPLRQLNEAELRRLAEEDLVDIFECHVSFRDQVRQLKSAHP